MITKWIFRLGSVVLAAVLLAGAAGEVIAQTYPTKFIKILIPAPAGGGTDILARILAQKLTESWGQQIIIDNRGGAMGMIAAELCAKAAPDGYTLFMTSGGLLTMRPHLVKEWKIDVIKAYEPVGNFAQVPNILVVNPNLPVRSVKELIALAKAKPGQVNIASSGVGVVNHMCLELFKLEAGVDMMHIPYKGGVNAVIALLGGQVNVMFNNLVELEPHIRSGKLIALATATPKRIAAFPDLPTVAEAGVPGFQVVLWYGIVAPAGTPKNIITKLSTEITKIQKMPDVLKRLAALGSEPLVETSKEFNSRIKDEWETMRKLVKEAGIKPQ